MRQIYERYTHTIIIYLHNWPHYCIGFRIIWDAEAETIETHYTSSPSMNNINFLRILRHN